MNWKFVVDDWKIGMNLCEDWGFVGRDEVRMSIGCLMCGELREGVRGVIGWVKMSLEGVLECSGLFGENLGLFVDGFVVKVGLFNGKV